MKKVFVLLMLVFSISSLSAQWSVSPEAGLSIVKRKDLSANWSPRFRMGVNLDYDLIPEKFALRSGLHYAHRGYKFSYNKSYPNFPSATDWGSKLNRGFLQLPILGVYTVNLGKNINLNLAAGPYIGYAIHSKSSFYGPYNTHFDKSVSYNENKNYYDNLQSFDWGLTAQVAIEYNSLYIKSGYEVSLGKEVKGQKTDIYYHSLMFTAGYKFKLSK